MAALFKIYEVKALTPIGIGKYLVKAYSSASARYQFGVMYPRYKIDSIRMLFLNEVEEYKRQRGEL